MSLFAEDQKHDAPGSVPRATIEGIALRSCAPFDRIAVTTLNTVYEIIVLSGDEGDVLVRGGRFAEFCPARIATNTALGFQLEPEAIEVGLRLGLVVGGKAIVTSTVQSVRRVSSSEPACQ